MNSKELIIPTKQIDQSVIKWLLEGDPSIRWQVMRDLLYEPEKIYQPIRNQINTVGWGKRLLSHQNSNGLWANGIYSPKWISTTYTLLLLRRMGLQQNNSAAQKACMILLDQGFYKDFGINFSKSMRQSETCITGMVLSLCAYFQIEDSRVDHLVEHLLREQMPDGGWNCRKHRGATHSSFHTTINVLEGFYEYIRSNGKYSNEAVDASDAGREFFLNHRLYRSHRNGNVVKTDFTRFSFPPRWYHDILRTLDYFQMMNFERDSRLEDPIDVLISKQTEDGRWLLQNNHPGKVYFEMEKISEPSRWNTLRALRVLGWWNARIAD